MPWNISVCTILWHPNWLEDFTTSVKKKLWHSTFDGVIGPAQALTAIRGSLGLQDIGGKLTPHLELSGDQGVPMNGCDELSSDLSSGTKYWPGK